MDISSIAAALQSLKTAGEILKGLASLHTSAEVTSRAAEVGRELFDAYTQLFEAQATQAALIERIRDLEKQVADVKNWEEQKQRYQLYAPYPGCFVYAVKRAMSNGEPAHYLCTNCYENGKRSILQISPDTSARAFYRCTSCGAVANTPYRGIVFPKYAEELPPPPEMP